MCAGLHADRVAAMAGIDLKRAGYKLHYWKGEYFSVGKGKSRLVKRLVYPVPLPEVTGYNPGLVDKGRQEVSRLILQKQIKKRFGALPQDIEEMLNALKQARLKVLAEKILEITTEEELRRAIAVRH
jgi:Predicted dehydrogenase